MTFDPVEICAVLSEEGVEFVVLGGFAAIIHGSSLPTGDIDVIPSLAEANLERLATALKRLEAKIRTGGEPIEAKLDAAFILNMPRMLNLETRFGDTPWNDVFAIEPQRLVDASDGVVIDLKRD